MIVTSVSMHIVLRHTTQRTLSNYCPSNFVHYKVWNIFESLHKFNVCVSFTAVLLVSGSILVSTIYVAEPDKNFLNLNHTTSQFWLRINLYNSIQCISNSTALKKSLLFQSVRRTFARTLPKNATTMYNSTALKNIIFESVRRSSNKHLP